MSVSSHAASSGSQWSVCIDGRPMWYGFSGKLSALNPRAALRRTSSAATTGSFSHVICNGMMRSGYVPAHTSWCQSFHARTHACPSSGSLACANIVPANPASNDGKHSDAQMPAVSMSAMRAWMSQQPLRISSKRTGSMLHSFFGRPITALRPMFGYSASSNAHAWFPPSSSTTRGARSARCAGIRPSKRSAGSMRWSSTEITVNGRGRVSGSGSSDIYATSR